MSHRKGRGRGRGRPGPKSWKRDVETVFGHVLAAEEDKVTLNIIDDRVHVYSSVANDTLIGDEKVSLERWTTARLSEYFAKSNRVLEKQLSYWIGEDETLDKFELLKLLRTPARFEDELPDAVATDTRNVSLSLDSPIVVVTSKARQKGKRSKPSPRSRKTKQPRTETNMNPVETMAISEFTDASPTRSSLRKRILPTRGSSRVKTKGELKGIGMQTPEANLQQEVTNHWISTPDTLMQLEPDRELENLSKTVEDSEDGSPVKSLPDESPMENVVEQPINVRKRQLRKAPLTVPKKTAPNNRGRPRGRGKKVKTQAIPFLTTDIIHDDTFACVLEGKDKTDYLLKKYCSQKELRLSLMELDVYDFYQNKWKYIPTSSIQVPFAANPLSPVLFSDSEDESVPKNKRNLNVRQGYQSLGTIADAMETLNQSIMNTMTERAEAGKEEPKSTVNEDNAMNEDTEVEDELDYDTEIEDEESSELDGVDSNKVFCQDNVSEHTEEYHTSPLNYMDIVENQSIESSNERLESAEMAEDNHRSEVHKATQCENADGYGDWYVDDDDGSTTEEDDEEEDIPASPIAEVEGPQESVIVAGDMMHHVNSSLLYDEPKVNESNRYHNQTYVEQMRGPLVQQIEPFQNPNSPLNLSPCRVKVSPLLTSTSQPAPVTYATIPVSVPAPVSAPARVPVSQPPAISIRQPVIDRERKFFKKNYLNQLAAQLPLPHPLPPTNVTPQMSTQKSTVMPQAQPAQYIPQKYNLMYNQHKVAVQQPRHTGPGPGPSQHECFPAVRHHKVSHAPSPAPAPAQTPKQTIQVQQQVFVVNEQPKISAAHGPVQTKQQTVQGAIQTKQQTVPVPVQQQAFANVHQAQNSPVNQPGMTANLWPNYNFVQNVQHQFSNLVPYPNMAYANYALNNVQQQSQPQLHQNASNAYVLQNRVSVQTAQQTAYFNYHNQAQQNALYVTPQLSVPAIAVSNVQAATQQQQAHQQQQHQMWQQQQGNALALLNDLTHNTAGNQETNTQDPLREFNYTCGHY